MTTPPSSQVSLAAGGQLADALPVLACPHDIALQPADVAALQQRRSRAGRVSERLFNIGWCRIEVVESTVCRGTVNQRVHTVGIRLQDIIEIVEGLVEISRR